MGGLIGLIISLSTFGILVVIGLFLVFPAYQARASGVKTQGVVQGIADCNEDSGGDTGGDAVLPSLPVVDIVDNVQPTVRFTDRQGQTHEVVDSICGNYGIGEQVTLWYVPGHPTTFSLEQDTVTLEVLTGVIAFFGLLSLVFALWVFGRFLLLAVVGARAARQGNVYVGGPPQMVGAPISSGVNHRVGEVVPIADRWLLAVTNVYPSQGMATVMAAPGRYYLLVQIALRGISNEPLNFAQATFRLYDAFGAEYQRVPLLEGAAPGFIQPGGQAAATLAFDVPGTLRQFRLSFYPPTSFLAQANWDIVV
ncbi:MAG TPA: DUF3592 domain-containing protein [Ktedonobacterales bacterium]